LFLTGCSLNSPFDTNYSGSPTYDYYYYGTEKFGPLEYNGFVLTSMDSLSTFGVDVDEGSYTFGRKKINQGIRPSKESVRIEEYINYFNQDYIPPESAPFSVTIDGGPSLFRPESISIVRIGLQGKVASNTIRKPWNITFLIDISGSMQGRLDFVKECLYLIVDSMHTGDKLSICTYAGSVGTILNPVSIDNEDKQSIKSIISELRASGSTAMASGLLNAYQVNLRGFISESVNRVLVCSDGDANVGNTSHEAILEQISAYVDSGITLSTLGFGQGNYNDQMMEQLANKGNGNYFYVDSETEAQRLFGEKLIGMMEVIAKDVKIQVEFHAKAVKKYRLIGYENRNIDDNQFTNEKTDAGEIGAGHRVTALYEVIFTESFNDNPGVVHLRYKEPSGSKDISVDIPIQKSNVTNAVTMVSKRLLFTQCVAEYAQVLSENPYATTNLNLIHQHLTTYHNPNDERDVELLSLCKRIISYY
jgi:Ca-activated chloride channel family protein